MIYVVDDDNTIREIEVYTLIQTGFEAVGFCDGASVLEALKESTPDLIILDIMMPEIDGIEVLRQIRGSSKTKDIPVILATAKGMEIDVITGLDYGADDYLVKPFGVMEMVSRVKAVLRRCKGDGANIFAVGGVCLNDNKRTVTAAGKNIELTYKEFEILKLFMKNPGFVFSRAKLLSDVWGEDFLGESRTVDMHIKTLRKKLGEAGRLIETVIGVGYRINGAQ